MVEEAEEVSVHWFLAINKESLLVGYIMLIQKYREIYRAMYVSNHCITHSIELVGGGWYD